MATIGRTTPPVGRMSPAGSVVWALVPLLTIGLGTMAALGWAAYRLRSRWLTVSAVLALVVTVIVLWLSNSATTSTANNIDGTLIVVVLIAGGLGITFAVRGRLVRPEPTLLDGGSGRLRFSVKAPPRSNGIDPAISQALAGRHRRQDARKIVEQDPALARDLRIGRPDLPRQFDDGGLVDVNHVPLAVIAQLPGMSRQVAVQIVEARDRANGFSFVEELTGCTDLSPELAEELAERLVFLS
ncbi:ComEA family DNA-binding protein [Streptacidiphilus albus]|uniref:ComEA family DNA-binding protein n=1 Tax=Streptacidiphilus albus TaxID=105425 RepID=UPI000ADAC5F5|nr:helix-hairpin-helix domain-containing protein [Streptacidiphilus albus]